MVGRLHISYVLRGVYLFHLPVREYTYVRKVSSTRRIAVDLRSFYRSQGSGFTRSGRGLSASCLTLVVSVVFWIDESPLGATWLGRSLACAARIAKTDDKHENAPE